MIKRMNKKGTHVGMILSFLIFVTFLAFLYSITQPATKTKQDKLDLMSYLETELMNTFSDDLITIIIDNSEEGCLKFEWTEDLGGLGAIAKKVTDSGGAEVEEQISSFADDEGSTTIEGIEGKIKFYYSNQFEKEQEEYCDNPIIAKNYEISLFRTTQGVFESKIKNISEEIGKSRGYYGQLKEKLGMAFDDEFGFSLMDENRNPIAGTEEKEVNADIYSEEIPIQYLDEEANIKPGFLVVKVW